MTTTEPQISSYGRYGVMDTCRILDIDKGTLRRYTARGYIKFGVRRGTCRKFYSGAEIIRFWKATI